MVGREVALVVNANASAVAPPGSTRHVQTPSRSLYAVEGVSAGFHAAARHRYDGRNSGDLVAGVRALAAQLHELRPGRIELRADGATLFDGHAAQLFLTHHADTMVSTAVAGLQRNSEVARMAPWSTSTSSCGTSLID